MSAGKAKGTRAVQYAPRACACGCGGRPRGWSARYIAGHRPLTPIQERLWERVTKGGPNDCWPWQGWRNAKGHGQIGVGRRDEGLVGTHRVAWESANGPVPDGLLVRHTCDNPPCCNPAHLLVGTVADNSADMVARGRGRGAEGPSNANARLTADEVSEIRRRHQPGIHPARKTGGSTTELATEFGISKQYVRELVRGLWRAAA